MALYYSLSSHSTSTTFFYRLIETIIVSIGILRAACVSVFHEFDEPVYFQATQLYRDMVSKGPDGHGRARDFVCRVRSFWSAMAKRHYRDRHYPDCSVVPLGV